MNSEKNEILLFPVAEELKAAVEKLREEVCDLLYQHDELLYVECRNIEMAYMLAIGALEHRVFKLTCESKRLKRKKEIIQEKLNRQEEIVLADIDKRLDQEFAEYQCMLDDQIDQMNRALERSQAESLSKSDADEIKKLYRAVVKALHPDLNPELTEGQLELFIKATRAYETGDLETLRIIYVMVDDADATIKDDDPLVTLKRESERLEFVRESLIHRIEAIKSKFPYTKKFLIEDKRHIAEEQARLNELIKNLKKACKCYEESIEKMVK